jgi:pimeloyl-ACP methyl ester carboxylesterase
MAEDLIELMARLGHQRFHAVGHDRGGYVVQRLALDHPNVVDRVVILGDVPIGEALARCNARFAQQWWPTRRCSRRCARTTGPDSAWTAPTIWLKKLHRS